MHVSRGERGKIGVVGFFGRGNCGDEALVQCIYEAFSDSHDMVIAVDQNGAYDGWWDWYPYAQCERIHQGNIHYFYTGLSGLIVGGGGLRLGFGASQAVVARAAGTPTALVGTDYVHYGDRGTKEHVRASQQYLRLFDYVALRTRAAVELAKAEGMDVRWGADWAFMLQGDESREVIRDPKRVIMVLRELPPNLVNSEHYRAEIAKLVRGLASVSRSVMLLPFAPEDERFARELGLDALAPTVSTWWNPRRAKQWIESSGLVISVGRLHPMIFALASDVPALLLSPAPGGQPTLNDHKTIQFANEYRVPVAPTVDSALAWVGTFAWKSDEASMQEARDTKRRLASMIEEVRAVFE